MDVTGSPQRRGWIKQGCVLVTYKQSEWGVQAWAEPETHHGSGTSTSCSPSLAGRCAPGRSGLHAWGGCHRASLSEGNPAPASCFQLSRCELHTELGRNSWSCQRSQPPRDSLGGSERLPCFPGPSPGRPLCAAPTRAGAE